MRRLRRRHLAATQARAPLGARQLMMSQMCSATLAVRNFPCPPVISPTVYARIWYEWTGRRQWIVAPSLELLD